MSIKYKAPDMRIVPIWAMDLSDIQMSLSLSGKYLNNVRQVDSVKNVGIEEYYQLTLAGDYPVLSLAYIVFESNHNTRPVKSLCKVVRYQLDVH